jgi:hypothetical protein
MQLSPGREKTRPIKMEVVIKLQGVYLFENQLEGLPENIGQQKNSKSPALPKTEVTKRNVFSGALNRRLHLK